MEETMHGHREAMLKEGRKDKHRYLPIVGVELPHLHHAPPNQRLGRENTNLLQDMGLSSITLARTNSSMGSNNSLHPLVPRSFRSTPSSP